TRRTVCPDRTRRLHMVPTPRRIDPRGKVALRRVPRDRRLPRSHARHRVAIRALRHLRRHLGSRTPGAYRRTRQQQEERPGRHHRPPRHHRRGRRSDPARPARRGRGGVSIYYEDESVQLWHGDCLGVTEWLAADGLATDPPYGISWVGVANYTRGARVDRRTRGNESPISGDGDLAARDAVLAAW